ncbi:MAG: hypothetical protein IPK12_17840 [Gemmatimonadetes bacterium]|nr:hypothetical protein [Gemmatimonadota bacterium]
MDTGMHGTDRVLLVSTDLRLTGMAGDSLQVSLVERLLERVRALPGVEAAAVGALGGARPRPLNTSAMTVDGYPAPSEEHAGEPERRLRRLLPRHGDRGARWPGLRARRPGRRRARRHRQ